MADYQAPSWAQAPGDHTWTLVEIKNGTEIAQHALGKPCVSLGRAADMVDIELAHESCSRRHARIAFDSRGVPWLRDLASTHGTSVNKKALPAAAIGKVESVSTKKGARGVVLFPGDLIQFGGSTRLFCLEGPQEFERGAMKAIQQQQEQQAEPQVAQQPIHEPQFDEPEESAPKALDDDSIPPQHQKEWEALKARRYKQQNLATESQRIEAKGELSAGQERQLERNRQRLVSLQEDIDQMEQELLNKIYPGAKGGPKRLFNAAADEDDVDDRTNDGRRQHTREAETEETLLFKWKQDHRDYIKHSESIDEAESRVHVLQDKVNAASDSEDAFFLQNELDLAQDVRNKAKQRREEVLAGMKDSEKLLRIVNNKIITDLQTGYIGTEKMIAPPPPVSKVIPPPSFSMPPPAPGASKKMPPPPAFSNPGMLPPQTKRAMPPPPSFNDDIAIEDGTSMSLESVNPKPKRARVVGPAMPPPPAMPKQKSPATPASAGTLSFLSAPSTTSNNGAQDKKKAKAAVLGFDGKKDEWVAPTGQDGSGRTKLNEKFAGRY
jgi:pSer/pThr/pTyr-binding forkhead associated (FHA) protein